MFFIFQPAQNEEPDINMLIDKYSKNLMRLCYLYLHDHHLAEEAAWDTLYKVYKKYNSFRGDSSEKTWVTRIAINICKSYIRKPSYREIPNSGCVPLSYASESESDYIYRREESLNLLNAVYALPVSYKEVILLYYYQELSTREIANILHEKENTISVRLKRAREILKETLKEE